MKRPSFQFYPGDWQRDTKLKSCSIAAKGLWMELICIMHDSDAYGMILLKQMVKLQVNQEVKQDYKILWCNSKKLALMCGLELADFTPLLEELFEQNVAKIDGDGNLFSKRMQKDELIRVIRSDAGSKGGNPKLKGSKKSSKPPKKNLLNQEDNQIVADEEAKAKADEEELRRRRDVFIEQLKFFEPTYGKQMIDAFARYWTESNKHKKMKFELQETFEISKRLVTWKSNESKFNPNGKSGSQVRKGDNNRGSDAVIEPVEKFGKF